ncbi:MAG: glycosyltransferase family 39 protein [Ignavibacteriae bacterium]|nr:glycosyltransferase family 39 protein [Ignavibacteriota bacterium]
MNFFSSESQSTTRSSFAQRVFLASWRPYAWICISVFAVYGKTIFFHGWTYLDDHYLIVEGQPYLSDPSHVLKAFAEDVFHRKQGGMYYRPLLTLSFMLDTSLGGTDPLVYHIANIAYHIFACFLLVIFFKELKLGTAFAFCASVIFAVHPATAQTVAWIPGRNDSLLAIFVLLACISLLRFDASRRLRWLSAYILFFALALATKENALMFVPLSILYLGARSIQGQRFQIGHYLLFILGWFFVLLYWHYAREAAMILKYFDYSQAFKSVLYNSKGVLAFFQAIFWPWNLFTVAVTEDLLILPGLIGLLLGLVIVLFVKEKRWSLLLFGFSWFVIYLLPTFYRFPDATGQTRYFEHRVYLSLIGFLLMTASVSTEKNWKPLLPYLKPVFVALCLFLGVLAFQHSDSFAGAMALSEQTARSSPRSTFCHLEIGMMNLPIHFRDTLSFSKRTLTPPEYYQRLHEIEERTLSSLEQEPARADDLIILSATYLGMGRLKSAEAELQKLLTLEPENVTAQYNLGVLYYHGHAEQQSVQQWLKTLKLDSSHADAHRNLCYVYYREGDLSTALYHAEQATTLGATIPEELLAELIRPASTRTAH